MIKRLEETVNIPEMDPRKVQKYRASMMTANPTTMETVRSIKEENWKQNSREASNEKVLGSRKTNGGWKSNMLGVIRGRSSRRAYR